MARFTKYLTIYHKTIIRPTCASYLERAKLFPRNIAS